jgi:hypothetical protein
MFLVIDKLKIVKNADVVKVPHTHTHIYIYK